MSLSWLGYMASRACGSAKIKTTQSKETPRPGEPLIEVDGDVDSGIIIWPTWLVKLKTSPGY